MELSLCGFARGFYFRESRKEKKNQRQQKELFYLSNV